jgi:hypothetical protein
MVMMLDNLKAFLSDDRFKATGLEMPNGSGTPDIFLGLIPGGRRTLNAVRTGPRGPEKEVMVVTSTVADAGEGAAVGLDFTGNGRTDVDSAWTR